jgi:succinate dehydrogenase/fumarate reductase flavoprotein subunit
MSTWQKIAGKDGQAPEWPYPLRYDKEQVIETDILVLGGGIAGCWAAISAARKGAKVVLVEKGDTVRSGAGGPGCDNWCDVPRHPLINVNPDEWAQRKVGRNGYGNGIGYEIQCRENYDALLEMEQMGGKIRDYEGEYKGCKGYDEKSKFMVYRGLSPMKEVLVWGHTFKPALKKECQRLGVKILDRVMATSLLTEKGVQGSRVVGATGLNSRTGEFLIFKAKATILCMGTVSLSVWLLNTELAGYCSMYPRPISGDGTVMAWTAGAEITLLEKTADMHIATPFKHKWYSGTDTASYRDVPLVDANGKPLPDAVKIRDDKIHEGILKGEYALPFYGDFTLMPEIERRVTWGMMVGQESTTHAMVNMYNKAGFDPNQDMLMNYEWIEGSSPVQWRQARRSGLIVDWDLKSSLDGLYAAGTQMFSPGDHSFAAATGRYAGRKAVDYARQVDHGAVSKQQVAKEKVRVYAPVKRSEGVDWKELHAGITRVMQYFCSEYKTENLLNMGLGSLKEIEEKWVPKLYALDPHKLMRSLEDLSILTSAQMIMYASLARKASSQSLEFYRIDYPIVDPPEWNKFITLKQENEKVKVGEKPLDYAGNLKTSYEAHNRDYSGVYKEK